MSSAEKKRIGADKKRVCLSSGEFGKGFVEVVVRTGFQDNQSLSKTARCSLDVGELDHDVADVGVLKDDADARLL